MAITYIEIDENFMLARETNEAYGNCYYLRKNKKVTDVEIWGPGRRWGNLLDVYPDSFLVIHNLNTIFPPWKFLAGPFDTIDEAGKVAANLCLLMGI